jgi:hypothetical protein
MKTKHLIEKKFKNLLRRWNFRVTSQALGRRLNGRIIQKERKLNAGNKAGLGDNGQNSLVYLVKKFKFESKNLSLK